MSRYSLISPHNSKYFLFRQLIHLRLFADLKKSFLGWAWLIILPFIAIITWIFMKGAGIIQPGEMKIPYAAFVILSTTIWAGFFDTYKNFSQIFQTYGKTLLVNKLPMDVLILSEIVIGLIKFLIPFTFILVYFLYSGISLAQGGILFPLAFIPLVLLGASIGLLTGLFNAIAKDFSYLVDNLMRLLMLLSPVVYATDVSEGILATILTYNPLTYLISSTRDLLLFGQFYKPFISLACSLLIVLLFLLLARFFIINTSRILERAGI